MSPTMRNVLRWTRSLRDGLTVLEILRILRGDLEHCGTSHSAKDGRDDAAKLKIK